MPARTDQPKNPADVKRRALKLVGHAATKAIKADADRIAAWKYAAANGASSREIAEADGAASHMTVARAVVVATD